MLMKLGVWVHSRKVKAGEWQIQDQTGHRETCHKQHLIDQCGKTELQFLESSDV